MQANLRSVSARRSAIAAELANLQAEHAELMAAEAVLIRLSGSKSKPNGANGLHGPAKVAAKTMRGTRRNGASQRELVLMTLKKSKTPWLKVADIVAAVKSEHRITLPVRSVAPLMSTLKKSKVIVRK